MRNMQRIQALALVGLLSATAACGQRAASTAETSAAPASGGDAKQDSKVTSRELEYRTDATALRGFLVYPDKGSEKRPAVIVVHEWWGLNDYARSRARQLAELGYVALAVDMYGEGRNSDHPEDAKKLMSELMQDRAEATRRFEAAQAALAADPRVDATKIAAIGYCLGGAVVLHMARKGADLDAVASFHGNYATETPLAKGKFPGKIFIAHGEADSFTSLSQVAAMKNELEQAGADATFVSYPGAKHGFTNPEATALAEKTGMDIGYDPAADAQSWQKLQQVLAAAFAAD
jgi:dienelactone hydrolase